MLALDADVSLNAVLYPESQFRFIHLDVLPFPPPTFPRQTFISLTTVRCWTLSRTSHPLSQQQHQEWQTVCLACLDSQLQVKHIHCC